jgi:hypothetical protein
MALAPNVYSLQGSGITVGYGTGVASGFGFFYQDSHQTLRFQGNEIRTLATEIGTLVTVTLNLTLEIGSVTFTLVVPSVVLDGKTEFKPVPITTVGVVTSHRLLFFPGSSMQTESYTPVVLTGTAEFIPL